MNWELVLAATVWVLSGMALGHGLRRGWEWLSTRRDRKRAESRLKVWGAPDNPSPVTPDPESERLLMAELMRRLPPENYSTSFMSVAGQSISGSRLPRSSSVNLGGIPKPSGTAGTPLDSSKSAPPVRDGRGGGPTWDATNLLSGQTPLPTQPSPYSSSDTTSTGDSQPGPSGPASRECRCGHLEREHIYFEGACRPGFVCGVDCQEFELQRGDA